MKQIVTVLGSFVAVFVVAGMVNVSGLATEVNAAEATTPVKTEQAKATTPEVKDRTYVAGAGDSYTAMVRKAVQTYGINHHVDLGNARIVYIETMMTRAAGSPYLWLGQKVTIKGVDVKNWADKALKLSDQDVAAWQTYVASIDFNTDAIGKGK